MFVEYNDEWLRTHRSRCQSVVLLYRRGRRVPAGRGVTLSDRWVFTQLLIDDALTQATALRMAFACFVLSCVWLLQVLVEENGNVLYQPFMSYAIDKVTDSAVLLYKLAVSYEEASHRGQVPIVNQCLISRSRIWTMYRFDISCEWYISINMKILVRVHQLSSRNKLVEVAKSRPHPSMNR